MKFWGNQKICVTGGCGFLGRHLVRELLDRGARRIQILDNLSAGSEDWLPPDPRLQLHIGDIRRPQEVRPALEGVDLIFHLAAPTDVRAALRDCRQDIDQGILGTATLLECAHAMGISKLVFASSSCVYGNNSAQPAREEAGPLLPASLYGASKLAAEGLISAYCQTFQMQSWLFRFPNVVGPELTHGVCLDFVRRLQANPRELEVMGNGQQRKTYMWVSDCVEGILALVPLMDDTVNLANVTTRGSTTVREIAEMVLGEMGLSQALLQVGTSAQGWPGDVPHITLDEARGAELGWRARYSSSEALLLTVRSLLQETTRVA